MNRLGCKLTLQEIRTAPELERLQGEWWDLWNQCEEATPFQLPEWLLTWSSHFCDGDLSVLALYEGEELVALAPFVCRHTPEGENCLQLLGTGITDYLDILVKPEFACPAVHLLTSYLLKNKTGWDYCDFQQLRLSSLLLRIDAPVSQSNISLQEICPVLDIPSGTQDLSGLIPKNMSKKVLYYRNRAEKAGSVEFQKADEQSFESLFDSFLELHRARWAPRGRPGAAADENTRRFHRQAARALLHHQMLRLYCLRLGGQVVATLYGFSSKGRTFYYLAGFDPEWAPISPGTLLLAHAIQDAIQEHAREFDFLRGRETYKYFWGARDRPTYRCLLGEGSLGGP